MSLQVAELCAGYGGLYMGLKALWPDAELNWYAEVDRAACRVLEHHHPDAENQGDITRVDWGWLADTVDIMAAGTPCQDISSAGKGAGLKGRRSRIVLDFLDGVGVVRPGAVLWENVKAATWRRGELDDESIDQTVSRRLQEMGYHTQTLVRSAQSVGAPHRRERVFVWAWDPDHPLPRPRPRLRGPECERGYKAPDGPLEWVDRKKSAYSKEPWVGTGLWRWDQVLRGSLPPSWNPGPLLATPTASASTGPGGGRQGGPNLQTEVDLMCIPGTQDADGRLNPAFVEWMMGLPEGHVTGVPGLSRTAQLRLLGNGVVPLQAAAAVRSARRGAS